MKKRHLLKILVSAVVLVAAHAHAQTDGPKSPADLGRLLEDVAQCKTTLVGSNEQERHDLERLGVKVSVQMEGTNYTHVLPPGIEVFGHQASRAFYAGDDTGVLQLVAFPAVPGLMKALAKTLRLKPVPRTETRLSVTAAYFRPIPAARPGLPFTFSIIADTQEIDGQSYVLVGCNTSPDN